MYFQDDSDFEENNLYLSLKKGIMLCGGIGSGKSLMFKIFNNFTKEIRKNVERKIEKAEMESCSGFIKKGEW